jgi:hypothetical protein
VLSVTTWWTFLRDGSTVLKPKQKLNKMAGRSIVECSLLCRAERQDIQDFPVR